MRFAVMAVADCNIFMVAGSTRKMCRQLKKKRRWKKIFTWIIKN